MIENSTWRYCVSFPLYVRGNQRTPSSGAYSSTSSRYQKRILSCRSQRCHRDEPVLSVAVDLAAGKSIQVISLF
ncbi:uncharacterized protein METZ01_LOCUS72943 [marine metagenome]|uniref:Uncharacterized protein n=1 Tax=marine metagenome TaxID=408172 RepID=A0A381TW72_9ZZZZ